MSLDSLIMLAGLFVALVPFLGIPNSADKFLLVAVGFLVICFGIIVRRRTGPGTHVSIGRDEREAQSRPDPYTHENAS